MVSRPSLHSAAPQSCGVTAAALTSRTPASRREEGMMDCPLVEGAVLAAVETAMGTTLEELAEKLEAELPDGSEKSAGMRKLLEAKDCFVRAAIAASQDADR